MQVVTCANQDPFLFSVLARKEKRFFRLAANAFRGPASRRPAKGAAAERRGRLHLPQAAAALSAQREKGASTRVSHWQALSRSPRISGFSQIRVQSWNSLSPLFPRGDASLGAAWCMRYVLCTIFPSLPGESNGGPQTPLAVSIREVLRRGRKRNLPLLSAASFATFLRASEEKLIDAGQILQTDKKKRIAAAVCALPRNDVQKTPHPPCGHLPLKGKAAPSACCG